MLAPGIGFRDRGIANGIGRASGIGAGGCTTLPPIFPIISTKGAFAPPPSRSRTIGLFAIYPTPYIIGSGGGKSRYCPGCSPAFPNPRLARAGRCGVTGRNGVYIRRSRT